MVKPTVPLSPDEARAGRMEPLDGDPLVEQVRSALRKVKGTLEGDIPADSTLESLGLDSLDTITLLFELEDRVGVSIPDDEARKIRTVGDIIEGLRRLKGVTAVES